NVDGKKVNGVWDKTINLLSGNPFSERHQIFKFIIRSVYDASFLSENKIIYLLERLQNADDNLLTKKLKI
ncbi:17623_t:CDS:1, partial [Dentiscutata erythropus]